jgi:hypothetical protein
MFNNYIICTIDVVQKMEDDFLIDSMLLYIENEITQLFSTDLILDNFSNVKTRQLLFSLKNVLIIVILYFFF